MTSSPSLNSYTPHRWARVVSGETWAEYGLGPSGQVEAKTLRGPLIVWATKPGEGEDLPRLEAPTPSPLEVQAARVNRKAHFLAFVRFAQGRRKTKTGRRVGFLRLWRGVSRKARQEAKREALERVEYVARMVAHRAAGGRGILCGFAANTAKNRREAEREYQIERFHDRLRNIAPAHWEDENGNYTNGWNEDYLEELQWLRRGLRCLSGHIDEVVRAHARNPIDTKELPDGLAFAVLMNDWHAVRAAVRVIKARRSSLAVTLALRALEAAAYRAHVTRRVRPPARRSRIPRPIYARPRPPTAPLAPPVTC